tara:strand:+ start:310 stop:528 length:219 start_codon:yes stop_codon:yes gene_type:complete
MVKFNIINLYMNNNTNSNLNKIKIIELQNKIDIQTNLLEELIKQNNNLELQLNKLEKIIIKREDAKTKGWIF